MVWDARLVFEDFLVPHLSEPQQVRRILNRIFFLKFLLLVNLYKVVNFILFGICLFGEKTAITQDQVLK